MYGYMNQFMYIARFLFKYVYVRRNRVSNQNIRVNLTFEQTDAVVRKSVKEDRSDTMSCNLAVLI